jgi:hypothetical protein
MEYIPKNVNIIIKGVLIEYTTNETIKNIPYIAKISTISIKNSDNFEILPSKSSDNEGIFE